MLLTRMMQQHYGKPVILLIDEYDAPVAKANNTGYYAEMLDVMKGLMQALKDNQALRFAAVTGCLKIAKESIFTGTNNFVSDTITNSRLSEYFGFVQSEVDQLLKDADLTEQAENIKKWYDGYHFGDFDVYCPWDVMNYMLELQRDPKAKPKAHGMIAEKPNSIYQKGGYTKKDVEKNILSNPFKRFEDMRFLMRCKDVETVEVNPIIFRKLTREDWLHIVDVCDRSLEKYYMRFKK